MPLVQQWETGMVHRGNELFQIIGRDASDNVVIIFFVISQIVENANKLAVFEVAREGNFQVIVTEAENGGSKSVFLLGEGILSESTAHKLMFKIFAKWLETKIAKLAVVA